MHEGEIEDARRFHRWDLIGPHTLRDCIAVLLVLVCDFPRTVLEEIKPGILLGEALLDHITLLARIIVLIHPSIPVRHIVNRKDSSRCFEVL